MVSRTPLVSQSNRYFKPLAIGMNYTANVARHDHDYYSSVVQHRPLHCSPVLMTFIFDDRCSEYIATTASMGFDAILRHAIAHYDISAFS
jgi:hypothetical protein